MRFVASGLAKFSNDEVSSNVRSPMGDILPANIEDMVWCGEDGRVMVCDDDRDSVW